MAPCHSHCHKHHSGFFSKLCCKSCFLLLGIAKFGSACSEPVGWPLPACLLQGEVGGQQGVKVQRSMVCAAAELGWLRINSLTGGNKYIYTHIHTHVRQLQHWLCTMVSLSTKCALLCSMALPGLIRPPMHLVPVHPVCSGQVAATSLRKAPQEMDAMTSKVACDLLFPTGRKLE